MKEKSQVGDNRPGQGDYPGLDLSARDKPQWLRHAGGVLMLCGVVFIRNVNAPNFAIGQPEKEMAKISLVGDFEGVLIGYGAPHIQSLFSANLNIRNLVVRDEAIYDSRQNSVLVR